MGHRECICIHVLVVPALAKDSFFDVCIYGLRREVRSSACDSFIFIVLQVLSCSGTIHTCRMSRAVSVTTKMVKQAKAVTKVVQTPMTAAFVFSGTALFIHATVHIDSDSPAWTQW